MLKGQAPDLDPARAPTVFDIDLVRVARVYAEALLDAAEKQGKVDDIGDELAALTARPARRRDNPADPATLLAGSAIPRRRRADLLRKAFTGRADPLLLNFVLV